MLSLFRPQIAILPALLLILAIALPAQTSTTSSSPAGTVSLLQPLGLAYDAQGNLFFAEAGRHAIRRLDPSGTLTTVAGTGAEGFSGDAGPATSAQLDSPHSLALDPAGDLFVADTHNNRIRRIDALTGLITTVAGTGTLGFSGDGGPATSAQLAAPLGLAFDATGLYIADSRNHRIRRVDLKTSLITTVAGTGTQGFSGDTGVALSATFDTPSALTLDSIGNLLIADTGNHRVRRVDAATHLITTIAGASPTSSILRPVGLVFTSAGLLIADSAQQRVFALNPSTGNLSTLAGQGSQAFQGDAGPAGTAMLDSPAALALAPSGIVAIADTGNQRIRQINPDGSISTIAGLGTLISGSLILSGATTQSYGSATLVAALSAGSSAQGTVSLLDVSTGATTLLAQSSLSTGLARFSLPTLSAGPHQLLATFAGDTTHRAAQSQILSLTVATIPLTANLSGSLTASFGQPLPPIAATLSGALPGDSGRLSVTAIAAAPPSPAPGTYPIQLTLSGAAAANYTFAAPSASLTITKAPVAATLTQAATQTGNLVTVRVTPTTSGIPTGSITLLTSAGTRLSTLLLDATGSATISAASLADGAYSLTAIYSGDTDFLSAQSTSLNLTIGPAVVPADFSFAASSSAAQTINAGATAQFTLAVKTTGSLAGPIALSASGLPQDASANFDPAIIPPGGAVTSITLSVVTPRASAAVRLPHASSSTRIALACLAPIAILGLSRRRRRLLLASLATLALCGCGARINSFANAQLPSASYPIVITGISTNIDGSILQHTATVTLTIQ